MAMQGDVNHPYAPRDLKLPGYVPIFLSESTIIGVYIIASFLAVSFVWISSGWIHKISKVDRLLMCWWIFSGLTHIILEGYFVFSPQFYKKQTPHYLAEAWKEYSKGDSRFVGRDSSVVSVIGIAAVLQGPACLLVVYTIAAKKSCYYILQAAISLGHLYITAVYFITFVLDGNNFASTTYYYYIYFVFVNGFWIVIPIIIVIYCWMKICEAQQFEERKLAKTS